MPNEQVLELRNRILGVLIRNARERARATRKVCADVLGVTVYTFSSYEDGTKQISLPELELLARYLDLPLEALREDHISDDGQEGPLPSPDFYLPLRNRIIGARLRQVRLEAGRTQQDLAELLGHSTGLVSAYEYGDKPVPLAELELASRALGVPLDSFLDTESEVGDWLQLKADFERFKELPDALREFVLRPINRSYLELAVKLAAMPAGALRQIAEGILEITY